MKPVRRAALALTAALAVGGAAPAPAATPGVTDPARAAMNYMLQCQGCHRPDGSGDGETAPALAGHMGVFTRIAGGRPYLGRVPGVATAPLSDAELAELLNWALWRFDPAHVAADFRPYDAAEIAGLRSRPLRTEAAAVRASLLKDAGLASGY